MDNYSIAFNIHTSVNDSYLYHQNQNTKNNAWEKNISQ